MELMLPATCLFVSHLVLVEGALCPLTETWVHFEGSCYLFVTTKETWESAKTACSSKSSTLAMPTSEEVQNFLAQQAKPSGKSFWLGATDIDKEGVWIWDSSGVKLEYFNWANGEPNNKNGNQNCLLVWSSRNLKWDDETCNKRKGYICQVPTLSTTTEIISGSKAFYETTTVLKPTTEKDTIYKTTEKVTTYPTTEKVTTYPTTEKVTTHPNNKKDTTIATTEKDTTFPTTEKDTTYPTTEKVTTYKTAEKVTTYPTTEMNAKESTYSTSDINIQTSTITSLQETSCANTTCIVKCFYVETMDEINTLIVEIQTELRFDKNRTSMHLRSLTSAEDPRLSSARIGYFAVLLLILVVTLVVLPDAINMCVFIKMQVCINK